jgi:capsular exopolysaccharide synthesis family protein
VLEYARIARRRAWIIVLTALLAGIGAYLLARRGTPVYQSQAEVLLRGSSSSLNSNQPTPVSLDVTTELRVVRGFQVQQEVKKTLPNAAPIAGASQSSTNSFTVTVDSTNPKLAADSANAYANAYIKVLRTNAVNDVLAASNQIQTNITELQKQIDALGPPTTAPAGKTLVTTDADVQRSALETQLANYRVQYNDLQVSVANLTAGAVVLRPAVRESTPIAPRPLRTALEAAGGGLILGLGLAYLLEYVDDTLRDTETLERLGGGLPVLGVIPTMTGWRDRHRSSVVVTAAPSSPGAEAYRYLRTAVRFLAMDRGISVIQITSPSSRDGKTTTVANLAAALAQVGGQVAVVDLDLRRPRIHEFFGLDNEVGFITVAEGGTSLSAALHKVPGIDGLVVLTSGPVPPNPSELLSSARAGEIIELLRARGWTVILDSPPLLPVTDATVVSTMADATILVTSSGLTKRNEVTRSMEQLAQVRAPVVGTVFNRAPGKRGYYYRYTSAYPASTPPPAPPGGSAPPSPSGRDGKAASPATNGRPPVDATPVKRPRSSRPSKTIPAPRRRVTEPEPTESHPPS